MKKIAVSPDSPATRSDWWAVRAIFVRQRLLLAVLCAVAVCICIPAQAQLPFMNTGPDSAFAQIDFAEIYMDTQNKEQRDSQEQREKRQRMVEAGVVSALDLSASDKAVTEFNQAVTSMKSQNSKEAIKHLQKAIAAYPKFVSAHNALGLAYLDQDDARAKGEFETAAKLDDKYSGSFVNLGLLDLSAKDFAGADENLEKAATLRPSDARILSALAFAENGEQQYAKTLATARRVHALDHQGMANVHYIAAAAAVAMNDLDRVQSELNLFLKEDPTNPLAPIAHKNLDVLAQRHAAGAGIGAGGSGGPGQSEPAHTFANSERLRNELSAVKDESTEAPPAGTALTAAAANPAGATPSASAPAARAWTIHSTVDETALFFAVSSHGHMISDLTEGEVRILDDLKPPQRITSFIPQSKLPLRLGLLVDVSGSVQGRFSFEKKAAAKFLKNVLNHETDLGFVAGFNNETNVTQDFTGASADLDRGVEKLSNGGGTALFDAASYACWKLAAYPDDERVARVLVVLSDGEDNSSHRSLKQAIEDAEASGVTVYTLSTREDTGPKSDADRILEALAERSGGEAMFPGDIVALDRSLERLKDLIRSRYLVAYRPADFQPDGKYRTIQVVAERDGKRLQVHTRKGYHARRAASPN